MNEKTVMEELKVLVKKLFSNLKEDEKDVSNVMIESEHPDSYSNFDYDEGILEFRIHLIKE